MKIKQIINFLFTLVLFISFAGFSAYLIHMQRSASLQYMENKFLPDYGKKLILQLEELVATPIEAVCIFIDIQGRPKISEPDQSITGYLREMSELEALRGVNTIDFFHAEENVLYSFDGQNLTGSRFGYSNRWIEHSLSSNSSAHIDILDTSHKENRWLYYRYVLQDDSSGFLGFVGLRIDFSSFTASLRRKLNTGQSVTIVNRNSQVLFDSADRHADQQTGAGPGFVSRTGSKPYLGALNHYIGLAATPKTVTENGTISYMEFNRLLNAYIISEQNIRQYMENAPAPPLFPILVLGSLTIGLNIFMILSYQRKIWEKNDRLARLNQEKDLYLSAMSHKVNNTLAVLTNEMLDGRDSHGSGSIRKNTAMLSRIDSTKRLITNSIMYLKHLTSDQPVPLAETVDLQEHLRYLILRNREKTERKKQNISFSSPNGPVFIVTNKQILEEILENLIDNAVKYSYRGSDITVGLYVKQGKAVITVCDQGPGFTEQDAGKIFSPFMQLTAKPTGGETSTGLGLFVAYSLSAKLGGSLRLEPDYSEGACFEVLMPLQQPIGEA